MLTAVPVALVAVTVTDSASTSPSAKPHVPTGVAALKVKVVVLEFLPAERPLERYVLPLDVP
ncbi:unannotated protein [freshwater metagenome]|uniref:Unannotated protein n=1 Tax=freshwater metagenome TaxID=449393 RepID=A0A6J7GQ61_9ZZZZ